MDSYSRSPIGWAEKSHVHCVVLDAAVEKLDVCIGVGSVAQAVADKVECQNADHHERSR